MRRNTVIRGPLLHATVAQRLNGANDVCRRFDADDKCHLAQRTRDNYIKICAELQSRYPALRVNEFEQHHLDNFFRFTIDGVTPRPRIGLPKWREATVNCYVNALIYVFGWAEEHDLLTGPNPALKLRKEWGQKRVSHRKAVWLKGPSIERLCDLDVGDDLVALRDRMVCRLIVGTGLRAFEASSLRWGDLTDIDSPGSRIHVLGKGNKTREVTPLATCRAALTEYRSIVTRLRGTEPAATDPVLFSFHATIEGYGRPLCLPLWDTPLRYAGIRRIVMDEGERIGQPNVRPHDLRRSHAGFLDDAGITLKSVKLQLGHESVATTDLYLEDNPGRLESEFAKAGI